MVILRVQTWPIAIKWGRGPTKREGDVPGGPVLSDLSGVVNLLVKEWPAHQYTHPGRHSTHSPIPVFPSITVLSSSLTWYPYNHLSQFTRNYHTLGTQPQESRRTPRAWRRDYVQPRDGAMFSEQRVQWTGAGTGRGMINTVSHTYLSDTIPSRFTTACYIRFTGWYATEKEIQIWSGIVFHSVRVEPFTLVRESVWEVSEVVVFEVHQLPLLIIQPVHVYDREMCIHGFNSYPNAHRTHETYMVYRQGGLLLVHAITMLT